MLTWAHWAVSGNIARTTTSVVGKYVIINLHTSWASIFILPPRENTK